MEQVNPKLPDWDIAAYIPGEKHGTREVFEEKLLDAGCEARRADAMAKPASTTTRKLAQGLHRRSARTARPSTSTATTPRRSPASTANKTGVGVFGLAFYENNADKLKVATVSGVVPSAETIAAGKYPVSRPLFFYVKKAHLGVVPGLKEYVEFFLSDQMIGPDSPLAEYGLVAAPDAERRGDSATRSTPARRCNRRSRLDGCGRQRPHPSAPELSTGGMTAAGSSGMAMSLSLVFALVIAGRRRGVLPSARQRAAEPWTTARSKPHSRPHYHGWWAFLLRDLAGRAAHRRLGDRLARSTSTAISMPLSRTVRRRRRRARPRRSA